MTSPARPCRMSSAWAITQSSIAGSRGGWKHQAAFHRYSSTWMKSITMARVMPRAAAAWPGTGRAGSCPRRPGRSRSGGGRGRGGRPRSKILPMVTSRPAVMSQVYQRFSARGGFVPAVPGSGRMTCSGVRAGPSGTATSKTAPVSAIRLQPFFSPVPARFSKVRTRCSGALVRRRRASGSIATPLPSAEIASGGRPCPCSCPAAGTAAACPGAGPGRTAPRPRPRP